MIRILLVLIELLGFGVDNNQPKNSLYKQPQKQINIPLELIIVGIVVMIIFVGICFMVMPGTESGLWYNHPHY